LAQRLAQRNRAGEGDVERSRWSTQGDHHVGGGGVAHCLGYASALPPEKDCIVGDKGETVERDRSRCRHQDNSRSGIAIGQESFPRSMSPNQKVRQVIEGDAFDAPVIKKEAAWLDQIDLYPEARREPQQGTGVLGYIRLEQGEAQTTSKPAW
jgi:hypothetical protein